MQSCRSATLPEGIVPEVSVFSGSELLEDVRTRVLGERLTAQFDRGLDLEVAGWPRARAEQPKHLNLLPDSRWEPAFQGDSGERVDSAFLEMSCFQAPFSSGACLRLPRRTIFYFLSIFWELV